MKYTLLVSCLMATICSTAFASDLQNASALLETVRQAAKSCHNSDYRLLADDNSDYCNARKSQRVLVMIAAERLVNQSEVKKLEGSLDLQQSTAALLYREHMTCVNQAIRQSISEANLSADTKLVVAAREDKKIETCAADLQKHLSLLSSGQINAATMEAQPEATEPTQFRILEQLEQVSPEATANLMPN